MTYHSLPNASLNRRQILSLLGGGAATAVLAACGTTSSGAPVDLAYAAQDFAGARLRAILRKSFVDASNDLAALHAAAWAEDSNATMDLQLLDDWREAYASVAMQQAGADIAEMFGVSTHIHADRLVDLSDLAEEIGAAQGGWIDAARDVAIVDRTWRAIPWMYTAGAINYRQDHLDAAGAKVPATYDELLETAVLLRENNQPLPGFSMSENAPNDSANLAYSMLWSFGGQEVNESGTRVTLDSKGTRAALVYFKELASVSTPAAFEFDEAANNQQFLESGVSMTQNASSIYWKARVDYPDVAAAMGHVKYPVGPAGHHQLVELNSLAVFDHSRNPAAAKDWIRYVMQPEQMRPRIQASDAFFIPSLLDYVDDTDMPWNIDPKLAGFKGLSDGAHVPGWPGPPSIEAGLVYENATIVRMFRSFGLGEVSLSGAVETATNELRRVYET